MCSNVKNRKLFFQQKIKGKIINIIYMKKRKRKSQNKYNKTLN